MCRRPSASPRSRRRNQDTTARPLAAFALTPNRPAVRNTGHSDGERNMRTSMSGSGWRSSQRANGTTSSTPSATSPQLRRSAGPLRRMKLRPPVSARSASEMSTRPTVSSVPPARSGDSRTPKRITTKHAMTATAGTSRSTVIGRASASAPADSAPAIAPSSCAATSRPAALRVIAAGRSAERLRDQMSATSSGSQTT